MRPLIKPIARFLAGVVLAFGLLMGAWPRLGPWPGIGAIYPRLVCAGGNLLYSRFGADWSVRFRPLVPPEPGPPRADVECRLRHLPTGRAGAVRLGSLATAYVPAAALVALAVATPTPWRRRLIGLGAGLLLIQLVVAARLAAVLWYATSGPGNPAPPGGADPLRDLIASKLMSAATRDGTGPLIAALVCWLIACVRTRDLWPKEAGTTTP